MVICTFFGHRDCPNTIKSRLQETLIDLITNQGVDMFYVGHNGQFDAIVHSTLKQFKTDYPNIDYAVVLAYMPSNKQEHKDYSDTLFPEGIETVHPRYAISWRNNWMLQQSDYVITYITHSWGGAAQFAKKAQRKNKRVINLA